MIEEVQRDFFPSLRSIRYHIRECTGVTLPYAEPHGSDKRGEVPALEPDSLYDKWQALLKEVIGLSPCKEAVHYDCSQSLRSEQWAKKDAEDFLLFDMFLSRWLTVTTWDWWFDMFTEVTDCNDGLGLRIEQSGVDLKKIWTSPEQNENIL